MIHKVIIRSKTPHTKEAIYINPKCGHKQSFSYNSPTICQETKCLTKVPDIKKLFSLNIELENDTFQLARVKYFAEGEIK